MTVPEDSPTSKPKLLGSLAMAAIPSIISSERLHSDTSAELTEETTAGSTACRTVNLDVRHLLQLTCKVNHAKAPGDWSDCQGG